jgi:hypothetical protein
MDDVLWTTQSLVQNMSDAKSLISNPMDDAKSGPTNERRKVKLMVQGERPAGADRLTMGPRNKDKIDWMKEGMKNLILNRRVDLEY